MGKTFHSKQEFKKLVKELGISAAKAKASRHPDGTRTKSRSITIAAITSIKPNTKKTLLKAKSFSCSA